MYLLVPPLSFKDKKPAYEIIAPSLPIAEAIPYDVDLYFVLKHSLGIT